MASFPAAPSPAAAAADQSLPYPSALPSALLPRLQLGGPDAAAADAASILRSLKAATTKGGGKPGATAVSARAAPRALPAQGPVVASVRRTITSVTYLRRLHVNGEMADLILPDMSAHVPTLAGSGESMRASANRVFFKRAITVVDPGGLCHAVTYESMVSAGQRHSRMSAGWGALMRHIDAAIGDAVVLELRCDRAAGVLHVRREIGGGAAAAATTT